MSYSIEDENQLLRKLLWLHHGCPVSNNLYGDDGEMQCNACRIDFKRSSAYDIQKMFAYNAIIRTGEVL